MFFSHDVGSGTVELRSDERLTMNQWHKINIERRGNEADLSVDTTIARIKRSLTPSSILNVDNRVYLGGLDARKERYGCLQMWHAGLFFISLFRSLIVRVSN